MTNDDRIKLLEENLAWSQKEIEELKQQIIDLQKIEIHYHLTTVYKTIPIIGIDNLSSLDEDENIQL
jgi:uncharacterized coiled-coil protein SlyX